MFFFLLLFLSVNKVQLTKDYFTYQENNKCKFKQNYQIKKPKNYQRICSIICLIQTMFLFNCSSRLKILVLQRFIRLEII